jgi:hypothetical protein
VAGIYGTARPQLTKEGRETCRPIWLFWDFPVKASDRGLRCVRLWVGDDVVPLSAAQIELGPFAYHADACSPFPPNSYIIDDSIVAAQKSKHARY